jgi:hypothetical protein
LHIMLGNIGMPPWCSVGGTRPNFDSMDVVNAAHDQCFTHWNPFRTLEGMHTVSVAESLSRAVLMLMLPSQGSISACLWTTAMSYQVLMTWRSPLQQQQQRWRFWPLPGKKRRAVKRRALVMTATVMIAMTTLTMTVIKTWKAQSSRWAAADPTSCNLLKRAAARHPSLAKHHLPAT